MGTRGSQEQGHNQKALPRMLDKQKKAAQAAKPPTAGMLSLFDGKSKKDAVGSDDEGNDEDQGKTASASDDGGGLESEELAKVLARLSIKQRIDGVKVSGWRLGVALTRASRSLVKALGFEA
ncbi:expressed unknown protein [Seminavis robusta]|uniref:Uncharacterized protein n=1 Tax=Seminavis robusta TaxID=568900 RepID=A0A9N8DMG2_9STRA|nr:expressed unknown protein [Seminavis robusta]|eukprot:Sro161_g072610.1 n/a (122) ;mRNA; f:77173-77538